MTTANAEQAKVTRLRITRSELLRYQVEVVLRSAVLFGAMLGCYYEHIPLWLLPLVSLVVYPAIYLRMHDMGHSVAERRLGLVCRFIPVSNPMWGGTRVFAYIHHFHHTYLGTTRDPWLPYYTGHPLRALFFNFIELEYSLYEFVRRRGVDRELVANALFNVASLIAGLVLFQWVYVVHLLSQRLTHMTGIFFFNFYTHRESLSAKAPIGAWEREQELRPVLPLLRLIWGRDVIDGLIYHNRHHCTGQTYVPVRSYKQLADTGIFSRFNSVWPTTEIKRI
jgi:hypothetical protein